MPDDRLTFHLERRGDDWRLRLDDFDLEPGSLLLALERARTFGPRESAGEVLEELGQTIDRLDARRHIEEVRVADGAPRELPPDTIGAHGIPAELVARVLEVLEDAAPQPLTTDRVAQAAGLEYAVARAALNAAEGDGAVGSCPGRLESTIGPRRWHLKPLGARAGA